MGFPAVHYCVILPPPLHTLLHLIECISRGCALPAALLFSGAGAGAGADDDVIGGDTPLASGAQVKNRLPVVRFAGCGGGEEEEDAAPRCAVCLGAVEVGAEVRQLGNCSHAFHRRCIDPWMDMGQLTCPLCRSPLSSDVIPC